MADDILFRKAAFGGFNREDVMSYIASIKNRENELLISSEQKDAQIALLTEQINALTEKDAQQEELFRKKAEEMQAAFDEETQRIQAECEEKIKNSLDSDRAVQEKVGSAMIDVRRYADLLINETCGKIDTMAKNADDATAKTLSRVLDISAGIQTFSDKLNTVIKDILDENENICKELTSFKGSLVIPFDEASEKVKTEILTG